MKIILHNRQKKLKIPALKINKIIQKIIIGEKIKARGQINICFSTNTLIKKFNQHYLKTNHPTDVLAFNLSPKTKKIILADIMISTDTVIKNSRIFKTKPEFELLLYVAHGFLHILGYNDHIQSQKDLMRQKEKKYVN